MIWLYQRQLEHLSYEIRRGTDDAPYEIVLRYPDGRERVHRYGQPTDLIHANIETHCGLRQEGWHALPTSGLPVVVN